MVSYCPEMPVFASKEPTEEKEVFSTRSRHLKDYLLMVG